MFSLRPPFQSKSTSGLIRLGSTAAFGFKFVDALDIRNVAPNPPSCEDWEDMQALACGVDVHNLLLRVEFTSACCPVLAPIPSRSGSLWRLPRKRPKRSRRLESCTRRLQSEAPSGRHQEEFPIDKTLMEVSICVCAHVVAMRLLSDTRG